MDDWEEFFIEKSKRRARADRRRMRANSLMMLAVFAFLTAVACILAIRALELRIP